MILPTVSAPALRRFLVMGASFAVLAGAGQAFAEDGAAAPADTAQVAPTAPTDTSVGEIVVTASTKNLIGIAETSSQGAVTQEEIKMRPVYHVGQLLETIPGLTVTVHSGEGKANQYLLRGFNLDHGTDLASFVDEMPVNMRTHAHGQGYSDLNFLIPEIAGGVNFSKGSYYAAEGDFSAVGADHISLINTMPAQVSVSAGDLGSERLFAGGSMKVAGGNLLAAGEILHLDGPWTHPDDLKKGNGALRYSHGDSQNGFSLTGLYYKATWNATTDQPVRAMEEGLIGRFGTLDPSDGGQSSRYSLSGNWVHSTDNWRFNANAYAAHYQLVLWNNFTHFLDDPINGDQHGQHDDRNIYGGAVSATYAGHLFGNIDTQTTAGLQTRFDHTEVDLDHTKQRVVLEVDRDDLVDEGSVGAYIANTTNWTPWFRSILGVRDDYFHVRDRDLVHSFNSASESKSLFQPKASIVFGPWKQTEFYLSYGEGFHSNDGRAGLNADLVDPDPNSASSYIRSPLISKAKSQEIGVRSTWIPHTQLAVTVFQTTFDSELTYDADAGADEAGRPSKRTGIEFTGQYRPFSWIELNANIAFTHARYTDGDTADGLFIEDAPQFIGSLGVLVDNLGPWSGSLVFRDLGPHPLTSDNTQRSDGDSEWNLNIGYKITPKLAVRADVFNLFNSKDDAADYYYTTRISTTEPAEGVPGLQIHPLEPRSFKLTVTKIF